MKSSRPGSGSTLQAESRRSVKTSTTYSGYYPKASLLELSTNGYNTETIVALANKYPNILIRVSLEGLPKLNDSKRGTVNGFDHALRTMLELKKTRCKNIGFSVVISPDNYKDLIYLYDLCVALDVELGNSVVHNSWYFHKEDNNLTSDKALHEHEKFVKALLTSKRRGFKNKLKDYGRAYFNRSIHRRLRGDEPGYRPPSSSTPGEMSHPATVLRKSGSSAISRMIRSRTS